MDRSTSKRLDHLADLARLAAAGSDVSTLVEAAVTGTRENLACERVAVFELSGDKLLLCAGSGWRDATVGVCSVVPSSGSVWAKGLECAGLFSCEGGNAAGDGIDSLLQPHGVKSGLHAPVRAGGKPWGLLGAYANRADAFRAEDSRYVRAAADMLATAIAARSTQEARARLGFAVEQAAEAIMITAADGTIVYVNPAFEKMTGYPAQEAVGRTPAMLGTGSTDRAVYRDLWQTVLAGRVWRGEMTNRASDGRLFTWEETITPVRGADGAINEFIAIGEDTSARRDLEARLRQSQKMEAVGRLAGGVAHDFNNLLTVIIGYSEQMLSALEEGTGLRRKAEAVKRSADRAAALTLQLLAFSRRQMLAPRVFDLNAAVRNMEGLLSRLIGEDIQLVFALDPEAGHVKADPHQVEQVVMNLAVNARDAMPRGGKLRIETASACVGEVAASAHEGLRPGRYATLAVADTGIGIDAETRAHLFEPFFTTKGLGKGTGLGLSTTFGIVKQSGGYVAVETEVGRGSVFTVYLPRVDEPVRSGVESPAQARDARGSETVLVVEDEREVRQLVAEVLESAGYWVLQAAGGPEALALVDRHEGPLDLVIADVVMPGSSGWDVARAVRERRADTAVLFVSGYTGHPGIERALAQSETALLAKPFTRDLLLQTVREVLERRRVQGTRPPDLRVDPV